MNLKKYGNENIFILPSHLCLRYTRDIKRRNKRDEKKEKEEPILKLVEQLQTKFGAGIIKRGIKLDKKPSFESKTSFSKDFLDDHER